MSSNGIIEHRKDYFYLEFREEYLIICKNCKYKKPVKEGTKCKASPHCKAFILAILERWTDTKQKKGKDLAVYMTYPQWVEEMHELFGRCVIIDSLDELIGEGLISREKHKMYGKDTYKYYLNYQELNQRVKLLPQGKPSISRWVNTETRLLVDGSSSTNRRDNQECHLLIDEDASKNRHNIECNTDSLNIDSGRKNDDSEQKTNATIQGESSHSSPQSSFSLIELTEDVQRIIDFAKKSLFRARIPEITEKLKSECAELALHIKTQQQFNSLLDYVKEKLKPPYHLKNMVNALNDWLQTQPSTSSAKHRSANNPIEWCKAAQRQAEESRLREEEEQAVSDEELAEEIRKIAQDYRDESNFEGHLDSIKSFRKHFKLSNYDLCDKIVNARRRAMPEQSDIQDFFYELRRMVV